MQGQFWHSIGLARYEVWELNAFYPGLRSGEGGPPVAGGSGYGFDVSRLTRRTGVRLDVMNPVTTWLGPEH